MTDLLQSIAIILLVVSNVASLAGMKYLSHAVELLARELDRRPR